MINYTSLPSFLQKKTMTNYSFTQEKTMTNNSFPQEKTMTNNRFPQRKIMTNYDFLQKRTTKDPSKEDIALAAFEWGKGDKASKGHDYTNKPEFRGLYSSLEDCFFLFEILDRSLWPELVRLQPEILNRCSEHGLLLATILETLDATTALRAFKTIQETGARVRVMGCLTGLSKATVDDMLTRDTVQRMNEARDNPQETNYFMATRAFLETLDSSARECNGRDCERRAFQDYAYFAMPHCLKHSFHAAHQDLDHKC
jgi:hypothetical protein